MMQSSKDGWQFSGEHVFPFGRDDQYFVIYNETGKTPITIYVDATPVDNPEHGRIAQAIYDALKNVPIE